MRVYFDACVLSRLSDDKIQARVRRESDAALSILRLAFSGRVQWFASPVLRRELTLNPDEKKREDALSLLEYAENLPIPVQQVRSRADYLSGLGYGPSDAVHLACAEFLGVDVLLTTDDRFVKQAARHVGNPLVSVANPVDWLQEQFPWLRMKP